MIWTWSCRNIWLKFFMCIGNIWGFMDKIKRICNVLSFSCGISQKYEDFLLWGLFLRGMELLIRVDPIYKWVSQSYISENQFDRLLYWEFNCNSPKSFMFSLESWSEIRWCCRKLNRKVIGGYIRLVLVLVGCPHNLSRVPQRSNGMGLWLHGTAY